MQWQTSGSMATTKSYPSVILELLTLPHYLAFVLYYSLVHVAVCDTFLLRLQYQCFEILEPLTNCLNKNVSVHHKREISMYFTVKFLPMNREPHKGVQTFF